MIAFVEEKKLLSESQFGFRAGYSTIDAVYTLTSLANIRKKQGKKIYACLIDLTAAFAKLIG